MSVRRSLEHRLSQRRTLEATLLALVREEPLPETEALEPERLVRELAYHRLVGFALQRLPEVGCEQQLLERLRMVEKPSRLRMLLLREAWRRLDLAFGREQIDALAVKGPVLAGHVYERVGVRLYEDLDVVVSRADFDRAVSALEVAGFEIVDRNWPLLRERAAGELKLALPGRGVVDLHWHLLFSREQRSRFAIPMQELLGRARAVVVDGTEYPTLDPVDTVLHLALHASREGADRLIWLKDIEQAVRRDPIDWDELVRRAHAWRIQLLTGTVLLKTRTALAMPVPTETLRALLGPRWYRVVAALSRTFPTQRTRRRGSPATLLARASSIDVAETMRQGGHGITRRLVRAVTTGDWRRDESKDDPQSEGSLLYAAGGKDARAAFFAELGGS